MELINLSIERIVIHQIHRRTQDGIVKPTAGLDLTRFEDSAMTDFEARVMSALGADSKAVCMEIIEQGSNDLVGIIDKLVDFDESNFIVSSYDIAQKLTMAQTSVSMSGGIIVVFKGTYGFPVRKFIGIIKADIYSGYKKNVDEKTQKISLEHIKELLLTPSSKLYKTIGFFEKDSYDPNTNNLNDKWMVLISDNQINQQDGKAAARYFYESFAGCGYPQSSARITKQFYDATKEFIISLPQSVERKNDLLNALSTYLKVDQSATVNPVKFAQTYFDVQTQDSFKKFLGEKVIPTNAFAKDTAHIVNELKSRRVTFNNDVKIIATPELFESGIVIEPIDGSLDENTGKPIAWTKIIVKGQIDPRK
ncbi:nucleoid-associated protein [Acinetobacter baumannii]|uniref:nucleoid-associated protein n=1 Tax=Acinetobacter baumannii TaxID=470 RepID=UPI0034D5A810